MSGRQEIRWGRGLDTAAARAYCGCDVDRIPGAPKPVKVSPRRKVWLREDLDAWLNRVAGKRAQEQDNPWLEE